MSEYWASGNWKVKEGSEEEFITRWKEFLGWTSENAKGFESASLIRQIDDPRHFVSVSQWADQESLTAWKQSQDMQEKLAAARELCDDFSSGDYARVVAF